MNENNTTAATYVNKNGEYVIPVSWSVYSTVVVKGAKNLGEAIKLVRDNLDEIPLPTHAEYVDGSYEIDGDTDEDFLNAQDYMTRGVEMRAETDNKRSYEILE